MVDRSMVLPEECWELIFNRLDSLEAVSLVCKRFFSTSNNIRHSLKLYNPTVEVLCRLLKRFRHLKEINLRDYFYDDIDAAVLQIAHSGLNLEALYVAHNNRVNFVESLRELGLYMKNLKTLECSYDDAIVSSLPWLEELDISFCPYTTDKEIEVLASKLQNLRKINISFNLKLTDHSIIALSSNCVFLREIKAYSCDHITQNGIGYLFRHSPNLVSLSVSVIKMDSSMPSVFTIGNSIAYAKALSAIKISSTIISDSLLTSIAQAHLPLKKFSLSFGQGFTISGLSMLLQAYQSLEELHLERVGFLTDEHMNDLSQYLHNVTNINLSWCCWLTQLTLLILIRNCPLLEEIKMQKMKIGGGGREDFDIESRKKNRIKCLDLAHSSVLNDEMLKRIGLSCPNLNFLNVAGCEHVTEEGIEEIVRSCKEIRHLRICFKTNITKIFAGKTDSELSEELKLEVLEAQGTQIGDEGMAMIAKRCNKLRYLNLNHSWIVTTKGVKEVVEKCKKLRQIKLGNSHKVDADILSSMLCSRPSLRIEFPSIFSS